MRQDSRSVTEQKRNADPARLTHPAAGRDEGLKAGPLGETASPTGQVAVNQQRRGAWRNRSPSLVK